MEAGLTRAWYTAGSKDFVLAPTIQVVNALAGAATQQGWHVPPEQHVEWEGSVQALQRGLQADVGEGVRALRDALTAPGLSSYTHIALEYDLRRRGLRLDALLFAPGLIVLLEFKRSKIGPGDRDQVLQYAINLLEFHEYTQEVCRQGGALLVPVLALTAGMCARPRLRVADRLPAPWQASPSRPLECDATSLALALRGALDARQGQQEISGTKWTESRFSPSTTIVDAAIAMYGRHDVSAIRRHDTEADQIRRTTAAVCERTLEALAQHKRRIVMISGAPGAGKTLVGLDVTFDPRLRGKAVFVTGNAPLVEVLHESLADAYRRGHASSSASLPAGYALERARHVVARAAGYPIVKAHHFLRHGCSPADNTDGQVVVFDEAQRTYESGRQVVGTPLEDHEANLILDALGKAHPQGCVVVALLGHNQAINTGERGAIAWFEAAEQRNWEVCVSDDTLALLGVGLGARWLRHPMRVHLESGHLASSMRFYRSASLERWAHALLEHGPASARSIGDALAAEGHTVWLTRSLSDARGWARARRVGEERIGIIASAQGRRLAAEGLFAEMKPPIAPWMLAPMGDPRSSNMLETVQNQYQIQGLELDHVILAWDLDLRPHQDAWTAHRLRGSSWSAWKDLDVAKNSYRVLLTRARKSMIIFVPLGDRSPSGDDAATRPPAMYDAIAAAFLDAGARPLSAVTAGA